MTGRSTAARAWHQQEDCTPCVYRSWRQRYACWLLQVFLMMMCSLKYGVFIFFGAWQTVALIFTLFLLPETRGVPIERVSCPAACLLRSLCCLVIITAGDGLTHMHFRVVPCTYAGQAQTGCNCHRLSFEPYIFCCGLSEAA